MVADSIKKVKGWCKDNSSDLFVAGIIFLTGLSSFGLGRISVEWKSSSPLSVTESGEADETANQHGQADKRVVASRSGSVYHYAWCPGASKIKEENKIWFPTVEDAKKSGLKLATNCPESRE